MAKYRVTLTLEERAGLEQLVSRGKSAARKLNHARILLLADEGPQGPNQTDGEIVEALYVGVRTVERVRQRFVTESLEAAVAPRPQPPRPEKIVIQGPAEQQLVELACGEPPAGRCCWTLQLLADQLVVLGCVEEVSRESVRRTLKKTASLPGS